jgi:predicted DNA-binding transcriptional regulator AlpA
MSKPHLRPVPAPIAVSMRELPALTSLSARTIDRLRSAGRFPAPDKRVGRRCLWLTTTIHAWLEGRNA